MKNKNQIVPSAPFTAAIAAITTRQSSYSCHALRSQCGFGFAEGGLFVGRRYLPKDSPSRLYETALAQDRSLRIAYPDIIAAEFCDSMFYSEADPARFAPNCEQLYTCRIIALTLARCLAEDGFTAEDFE